MIYEFERFAISYGLTLIIKRVNWLIAGPLNLRALCGCTVRTPLRPPLGPPWLRACFWPPPGKSPSDAHPGLAIKSVLFVETEHTQIIVCGDDDTKLRKVAC